MARINFVHVGAAGVLAGVVINVTARAAWTFVLPNSMIAGSYLWGFVVGIMTVWIYSSLTLRSGPAPARAVVAGMTAWLFAIAVPNYGFLVFETLSGSLVTLSSVLGITEVVPAALAGAWVYDWAETRQLAPTTKQRLRNSSSVRLTPHTPLRVEAI